MEKISWTNCVENEVSHTVKEERNILHTIKYWKANRIGRILHRNGLLQHVTEERWKGREDNEEEVGSYWMTLKNRSCRKLKEKHYITLSGALTLEEAMGPPLDRLCIACPVLQ
jgi:hypothetical protein